jgi:hypothetical protein
MAAFYINLLTYHFLFDIICAKVVTAIREVQAQVFKKAGCACL